MASFMTKQLQFDVLYNVVMSSDNLNARLNGENASCGWRMAEIKEGT